MRARLMRGRPGFTLMEMLVVLAVLGVLSAIAAPLVSSVIERSRETALRQNLAVMRKLIDDYHADRNAYPEGLETLVAERYLRAVPPDPVNGNRRDWDLVEAEEGGIADVRSASVEVGSDGRPYGEW